MMNRADTPTDKDDSPRACIPCIPHSPRLPFAPRFPWIGGDLQTIRSTLVAKPPKPDVDDRLTVPLDDGTGAISVAVTKPKMDPFVLASGFVRPVVLLHGLGGHEESIYVMHMTHRLTSAGFQVYRLNYRGVGHSRRFSDGPYNAGLSADVRAVLEGVIAYQNDRISFRDRPAPLPAVVGFSLGGQMLLRYLGEAAESAKALCCLAMSVSAPLDLLESVEQIERPRNRIYEKYLVRHMQSDLKSCYEKKVMACRRVREIDHCVIAPHFGYRSAEQYYQSVSCFSVLDRIRVPTFMLHALNDPWIPASIYRTARIKDNPALCASLTKDGGHVGFQDRKRHSYYVADQFLSFFDSVHSNRSTSG